jgi:hypothetical protein
VKEARMRFIVSLAISKERRWTTVWIIREYLG